ncbi:MAG: molybdate ABC transporter substrate-binding protein [Myxococcota bacterium]
MIACLVAVAAGCSWSSRTTLRVYAASSLTDAFRALEQPFEAAHPNVDLVLSFAGSQIHRLQIEHGAPADLFASANEAHLRALSEVGAIEAAERFARNEVVAVVPASSSLRSFRELDRAGRIVVGTEATPIGGYTAELFDAARAHFSAEFADALEAHVVSRESNVRLVRSRVVLGEADLAFVYRSDAGDERLRVVPLPDELTVRATYAIGLATRTSHRNAAEDFRAFLRSAEAQSQLRDHGLLQVAE